MKKITWNTENIMAVLFFAAAFIFPMIFGDYTIDNFANFYVTILISLSITLIWGFTGVFSFGQAVFYGLGAYTYAIISIASDGSLTIPAVLAAVAVAALAAVLHILWKNQQCIYRNYYDVGRNRYGAVHDADQRRKMEDFRRAARRL